MQLSTPHPAALLIWAEPGPFSEAADPEEALENPVPGDRKPLLTLEEKWVEIFLHLLLVNPDELPHADALVRQAFADREADLDRPM